MLERAGRRGENHPPRAAVGTAGLEHLLARCLRPGAADGAGSARQVASRLASAMEWRRDARGGTVLVAYGRDGSAVVPECLGWDGGGLVPTACPG